MEYKKGRILKVFGILVAVLLSFGVFVACGAKKETSALKVEKMVAYWESNVEGEFALDLKDKQTGERQSFTAKEKKFDLKPFASAGRDFTLTVTAAGAKAEEAMSVDFRAVNVLSAPTISVMKNTVEWEEVRGASGYRIQYGNEIVNLMNIAVENANPDVVTSYTVDVKEEMVCDVTVTAIGDGITYGDSEKSAAVKAMFKAEEKLEKVNNLRAISQEGLTFLTFDAMSAASYVVTVNDFHFTVYANVEEGVSVLTMPVDAMVNFIAGEYKIKVYARIEKDGKWINGEQSDEITVKIGEKNQLKKPLQSFIVDNKIYLEIDKKEIEFVNSLLIKMDFWGEEVFARVSQDEMTKQGNFISAQVMLDPQVANAMEFEIVLESNLVYKPSEAFKVSYTPKQVAPKISIVDNVITISGNSPMFKVAVMSTDAAPTSASYMDINNIGGKGTMNFAFKPGALYTIYVKNANGLEYKFNHRVAETPKVHDAYASEDYSLIAFEFEKDYMAKVMYTDKGELITLQYSLDETEQYDIYAVSVDKLRDLINAGTKKLTIHNVLSGSTGKSAGIEINIDKYAVPEVKQSNDSIYWSKTPNIGSDHSFYGRMNNGTLQAYSSSYSISETSSSIAMSGRFESEVNLLSDGKYSVSVCDTGSVNYSFSRLSTPSVSSLSDNRVNPRLVWDFKNAAMSYKVLVEAYNKTKDTYETAYPATGNGGAVQLQNYFDLGKIITEKGSNKYRVTIVNVAPNRLSSFKTVHEVTLLNDVNVWLVDNNDNTNRRINYNVDNKASSQKYLITYNQTEQSVSASSYKLSDFINYYSYTSKIKALGDNYNYVSSNEKDVRIKEVYFSDIISSNIISPRFVGSSNSVTRIFAIIGNPYGVLPYAFDLSSEYNLHNWTLDGKVITKDTIAFDSLNDYVAASDITLNANQFFIKTPSVENYPSVRIGELNKEVGIVPVYTSDAGYFDAWTATIAGVDVDIIPTYKVTNLANLATSITLNDKTTKVLTLNARTLYLKNYTISGTRAYNFAESLMVFVDSTIKTVDLQYNSNATLYIGTNVNSIINCNLSETFTLIIDEHNKNFVTKGNSIYSLDGELIWTNEVIA